MSYNPQNPNGQATSANSAPVVIASDQSAVKVDGSAVTQPISAASLPLPSTAATSTKQSDGSQKTQVVDGSGNVVSTTSNALDVNIKSGNPSSMSVTNGGTFAIQQTTATIPTATTMQNAATGNGNGTSLNVQGYSTAVVDVTASVGMSGGTTINFEVSPDDTTWYAALGTPAGGTTKATTTTSTGNWQFDVAGYKSLRARISSYSAGTITAKGYVTMAASGPDFVRVDPTGTTTQPVSGTITANAGTNLNTSALALESGGNLATVATNTSTTATNTSNIATNTSNTATNTTNLPNTIGTAGSAIPSKLLQVGGSDGTNARAISTTSSGVVKVDLSGTAANSTAVKVDNSGVTQPVSGTVTANAGTNLNTSALALDATLTGGTQKSKLVDSGGTNVATVSAGGALKVDGSAVTQPVSLTSTTVTGTVAVTESGTWNVGASTATGSTVPANAMYTGLQAKTANPTAASDGNLVGALADKLGKQVVVGSLRDLKVNQVTTITSSVSETTVLTAVASTFLDVYGCMVTNTSATAVNIAFKDSTGGTTQFNIAVPAGDTRGFMLPEGGAIKQGTVNNNWTATSSGSVASLVITMLAVKNT